MKRIPTFLLVATTGFISPAFAHAQPPTDFQEVILLILNLIRGAIGLSWAFIIAGFVYGVYKFLMNFDDEKGREDGKRMMFWSIVASAIALALYAILQLLHNSVTGGRFGIPVLTPPPPF